MKNKNKVMAFSFVVMTIGIAVLWYVNQFEYVIDIAGNSIPIDVKELKENRDVYLRGLAQEVEEVVWLAAGEHLNIKSDEAAKIDFFRKYHPELVSDDYVTKVRESRNLMVNSLSLVVNSGKSPKDVYEEHLRGIVKERKWNNYVANFGDKESVEQLMSGLSKNNEEELKFIVSGFDSLYLKAAIEKLVCELDEVKKLIDKKVDVPGFKEIPALSKQSSGERAYKCFLEMNRWVSRFYNNNVKFVGGDKLILDEYFSFNR